jgi:hypothetical protein
VLDVHCTRRRGVHKGVLPYSAPPHSLVADPRLSPTDVRVASALMFWTRGKDHCWPSDRSIGARVGRAPGTVQRSLRRLESAGWIRRERTDANRTGRLIVLAWRRAGAQPLPPMAREAPAAPARDELSRSVEGNRPKEVREPVGRSRHDTISDRAPVAEGPLRAPCGPPAGPLATSDRPTQANPAAATPAPVRPGHRGPEPIDAATLAALAAGDDPICRAWARARLGLDRPAAPPPKPAPASTAELLGRIREDPRFVVEAAELLSQDLDDRKSWPGFHAACRRAWEGSIPAEALVIAHREATSGKARSPGALFMAVLDRETRAIRRHR